MIKTLVDHCHGRAFRLVEMITAIEMSFWQSKCPSFVHEINEKAIVQTWI